MNMEPQIRKRDVIKALKDDITVESLFHKHVFIGPAILHKILRDYLVLNDFEYITHPNTTKIICIAQLFLLQCTRYTV